MTAGVGLVVRGDGSGCRLVEFDGAGRVVGSGERIRLSEMNTMGAEMAQSLAPESEPSIWSHPRVRAAGITLADVLAGGAGRAPSTRVAGAVEADAQAAFVRLAEQVGSYTVAAREHPEVWAAYRDAADLNHQEVTR
jgi:hypothetical protein